MLQRGFTLIELVIVMLVLAILAATALIAWPGETPGLYGSMRQLAADIRYAQSLAMSRGQRVRINFQMDRYTLSDRTGSSPVLHPVSGGGPRLLQSGTVLVASNAFLVFDGMGRPYRDAALPGARLGAHATLTLTAGTESISVQVTPDTGYVVTP